MFYSNKIWLYEEKEFHKSQQIGEKAIDDLVTYISNEVKIPKLISKILVNREMTNIETITKFINPLLTDLYSPFLFNDMTKTVDRIITAVTQKETIVIYGDYDVDGVTSTAILYDFLYSIGANVSFYIPDRLTEGYGITIEALEKINTNNVSLIITVDCGSTAIQEIEYANKNNIDVIITDHHECRETLPAAYAVINPYRHDSTYPFTHLAGVGVAYKLINALCIKMNLGELHNNYLNLVAIGTVADMVPLIDENRVIVKYGLNNIKASTNIGVRCLFENLLPNKDNPTAWDIGFVIAPKINAAGRMENADIAAQLFTTHDYEEANNIVARLKKLNTLRQQIEAEIYTHVVSYIENNIDLENERIIVAYGEGWHHGIIGIVASKICEKYSRPCVLICIEKHLGKGSGRSVEGFNLVSALENASSFLQRYGGHEQAVGITIDEEQIPAFRKHMNLYANQVMSKQLLTKKAKVDAMLTKEDINIDAVEALSLLEPFGMCNSAPIFIYNNLIVSSIKQVGGNKHIKLKLTNYPVTVDAIGFNMGKLTNDIYMYDNMDVICSLEINEWNYARNITLNLKDIMLHDKDITEDMYFKSLDKCITVDKTNEMAHITRLSNDIQIISTYEELIKQILNEMEADKNTIIFINHLANLRQFSNTVRKFFTYVLKKDCKLYFSKIPETCLNISQGEIVVVVNPVLEFNQFSNFNNVLFYGTWADPIHMQQVVANSGSNISIFHYNFKTKWEKQEIIIERIDLAVVYKHFKQNCNKQLKITDISLLAKEIEKRYNVNMNYFKVKKSIDIFEELNLIKKVKDINGLIITINENVSCNHKVNIEDSVLYNKLQMLK